MRKVKKRKIGAIIGAFVVAIACVFSCILPSTVKKETASAETQETKYKYENLFSVYDYTASVGQGTYEKIDNSLIIVSSTTFSDVYVGDVLSYKANQSYISVDPLSTYYFSLSCSGISANVDSIRVICSFFSENNSFISYSNILVLRDFTANKIYNTTIDIPSGATKVFFRFGYTIKDISIPTAVSFKNIMFSKNTYDYIPNLKDIYHTGYDQGHDQGYDAGVSEGLGVSAAGIMYGASISGWLNAFVDEDQSSTSWVSYGPYTDINYVDSGLSFQQLTRYLYGFAPNEWNKIEIYYTFANPVPYQLLKIVGAGNSTSFLSDVILVDEYNKKYVAQWGLVDGQSLYVLSLPELTVNSDIKIRSMTFIVGGGADGLDFSIYENDSKYLAGYADGYNAGNEDGIITGKVEGHRSGFEEGLKSSDNKGYKDGYASGFSDGKLSVDPNSLSNSIRTFIFSLFDAPFAVIEPFIELDVLGIDLGGIFSLILLVGLVSFIFKVI